MLNQVVTSLAPLITTGVHVVRMSQALVASDVLYEGGIVAKGLKWVELSRAPP